MCIKSRFSVCVCLRRYIRRLRILCGCVFSECYTVDTVQTTADIRPKNIGVVDSAEDCLISGFAGHGCVRADFVVSSGTCLLSNFHDGSDVSYDVVYHAIEKPCKGEYSHSCTCIFSIEYILLS